MQQRTIASVLPAAFPAGGSIAVSISWRAWRGLSWRWEGGSIEERGETAQRGAGAGRATGGAAGGRGAGAEEGAVGPFRGNRSIVSTSNDTPAARNARVTTSAGAEGSAPGSLSVTR